MLHRALPIVLALSMLASPVPALAAVHALLIGIDDYEHKQDLRGSVNDVRDLERVLKAANVASLATLIDSAATAEAFAENWRKTVGNAQPGDIIFLSFSGHGIRVPETGQRTTPDGYEKGFVLHGYDNSRAPDEILRDERLYDLFAEADARDLKVVFVADACHAGAAVRGTDPRAGGGSFRFQRFDIDPVVQQQPQPVEETAAARPQIPSLTVFSATVKQLSIQEVMVDGQHRGALSYAIARALEGAAGDAEGKVRASSVRAFVSPLVRLLTGNRQIPQFTMPDPELEVVDAPAPGGIEPVQTAGIMLAAASQSLSAGPALEGAVLVSDAASAELVWDPQQGQLLEATGDVLVSGLAEDDLQHALDARRVLNSLRSISAHQPGAVATSVEADSGDMDRTAFFTAGTTVRFSAQPRDMRFITMFNLSASGTVQLLWPIAQLGDPVEWQTDTPLTLTAPVSPPYGADYLVTVLSRAPLTVLHRTLEEYHGKPAPLPVYQAVLDARRSTDIRIGIESVYTCAYLKENGQCDSMLVSP